MHEAGEGFAAMTLQSPANIEDPTLTLSFGRLL
jgi:hypothetical protein